MGADLAVWQAVSEIVRNIGLVAAGFIALVFAGFRVRAANRQAEVALEQSRLAGREQFSELFNRAVGQLADEKLHVRLGAIYTLRRIAQDFPALNPAVFELLSAFLRESLVDYGDKEPPADVSEITRILAAQTKDGL